jgi:hypothetical protein
MVVLLFPMNGYCVAALVQLILCLLLPPAWSIARAVDSALAATINQWFPGSQDSCRAAIPRLGQYNRGLCSHSNFILRYQRGNAGARTRVMR